MSSGLENRILNNLDRFETAESFSALLHTKNIPHTRVNRALLHTLLGLPQGMADTLRTAQSPDGAVCFPFLYTQLIGFRREAAPMVKVLTRGAQIPVITKPSSAGRLLPGRALSAFEADMYAQRIYQMLCGRMAENAGYKRSVMVIE